MSSIAENIAEIRSRMAQAAQAAGRDVSQIQLVGASKMNDAAACRAAIAAGATLIRVGSAIFGRRNYPA